MAGPSHTPNPGHLDHPEHTPSRQSHYPDPEESAIAPSAWLPADHAPGTPLASHADGSFSLQNSRAEFESASARARSQSRELSDESDFLRELNDELEDISDADSEARDFTAGISKFKDDVRNFRASQHLGLGLPSGLSDNRGDGKPGGRARGVLKGPRKAAEPTGDIKLRLSKANEAFISGNYNDARIIVLEVIRINAETYEAWTILSAIFQELGQINDALMALIYASHLRPKDVNAWLRCAQFAQEETGENWQNYLPTANFCYSAALRADVKCVEARLGKARIYLERNKPALAVTEYKYILKLRPHDLEIVGPLAAAYVDNNEIEKAKELYKETLAYIRSPQNEDEQEVTWNHINAYVTLYECLGEYSTALAELKSLSRWLLGRESDEFWDEVTDDDREWDVDSSRRVEVPDFDIDRFPQSSYGEGLPLELRVRMGMARLSLGYTDEALRHLDWLEPLDRSEQSKATEYSDLYLQVARKFLELGLFQNALTFYQALKRHPSLVTPSLYVEMGKCFHGSGLGFKAEDCFQMAIQIDQVNIDARMGLANMYEQMGEQEQAFIYVNEVMSIKRAQNQTVRLRLRPGPKPGHKRLKLSALQSKPELPAMPTGRRAYKPLRLADPVEKLKEEVARAEQLQSQYYAMRVELQGMRDGNAKSRDAWMEAARDLTDDFRSFKTFYPWDKYVKFLGYTGGTRALAETPLDTDLTEMADRLSRNLGGDVSEKAHTSKLDIPVDYRGISFSAWLDIFLGYALCLARMGKIQESYEVCEAAKDAIVFYHSREDMFLIHTTWCMCAILSSDEETCVTVARFFMKDYQFTTDSYRMFAAVTRMCQSPISWYSSGPSQKYILRQIKAMDFALVDESHRGKHFSEKGSYSALDEKGRPLINDDMDIALLMLYGHILYTGTSYSYALNYFFRAYALDPTNPVINMNIGLAYVHYAIKRQSSNRQHLILQGTTFLFTYYESRIKSPHLEERQEAHYNMGRTYHMLGLPHLAIPYYSLVLKQEPGDEGPVREDLMIDATYNLQSIYAMAGNENLVDTARLVI